MIFVKFEQPSNVLMPIFVMLDDIVIDVKFEQL